MLKYELTGGGYRVFGPDGQPWVDVTGNPNLPATDGVLQPFASAAEADAHAIRTIAEITGTPATE